MSWVFGNRTGIKKPDSYSGNGVHLVVTDRDGKIISRKMLLIDGPYKPDEMEAVLQCRLNEVAIDILVTECGYRVGVPETETTV